MVIQCPQAPPASQLSGEGLMAEYPTHSTLCLSCAFPSPAPGPPRALWETGGTHLSPAINPTLPAPFTLPPQCGTFQFWAQNPTSTPRPLSDPSPFPGPLLISPPPIPMSHTPPHTLAWSPCFLFLFPHPHPGLQCSLRQELLSYNLVCLPSKTGM
jgi:hypothetical protein